jgi:hypothetical protein
LKVEVKIPRARISDKALPGVSWIRRYLRLIFNNQDFALTRFAKIHEHTLTFNHHYFNQIQSSLAFWATVRLVRHDVVNTIAVLSIYKFHDGLCPVIQEQLVPVPHNERCLWREAFRRLNRASVQWQHDFSDEGLVALSERFRDNDFEIDTQRYQPLVESAVMYS